MSARDLSRADSPVGGHSTPPDVVRHIDHRRQRLPNASRPRLACDRARYSRHETRVPRCRQRDRLREHRAAVTHEPVYRFLERDDRDAEPSGVDEVVLDGVDACGVRTSSRSTHVITESDLKPEHAVRVVVRRVVAIARNHEQLPELLVECHPPQQVAHALGRRQTRVMIRRARLCQRRRARRGDERNGEGRGQLMTQEHEGRG